MEEKVIGPRKAIFLEIVLFCAYVCSASSWLVGSITTPDMMVDFGIQAIPTAINNAISCAKILGNLVAAAILIRLGPKKTVTFALALVSCVALGAFALNFPIFIFVRFLMGFGGATLMICLTPYVVYCFEPSKRPIFNGINFVGVNTGNLIALVSIGVVQNWLGSWRHVVLFYGAFCLFFLLLWILVGMDYPLVTPKDDVKVDYNYRDGMREPFLYQYLLTNTGRFVTYTVLLHLFPLHPNFTVPAGNISLLTAVGGIFGAVIGILISKFTKVRDVMLMRVCSFLMTATFLLMLTTHNQTLALLCAPAMGILLLIPIPSFMTMPTKLPGTTPRKVAVILTLFWTITYIIQMIVYSAVVWMVNNVSWGVAIYFTAGYSILSFIGTFFLPNLEDPPDEMPAHVEQNGGAPQDG